MGLFREVAKFCASTIVVVVFGVGATSIILAACAPTPVPVSTIVAPTPKTYTCAQMKREADEHRALPADSMIAVFLGDYGQLRAENWAALKVPPPRCQK